jgi:DNA-binding transcriptional MocR family regulator
LKEHEVFTLDRDSPLPLAQQIESQLMALLRQGRLAAGARLPSIRRLAAQLGVSPNTVVVAYDRLVAEGWLEPRGTAGYFVALPASRPADEATLIEAGVEQDAVWMAQQAHDMPAGLLQASSGALPASWLQEAVSRSVLQRAFDSLSGGMATRCPPQGTLTLRERLSTLLRTQGIVADAARIMTTAGATQAIDLICRAFVKPGDAVIVEDPGYHLLQARLADSGARIVPVPRVPDGVDLARFEAALLAHRPRLAFIQTRLHNPTGWTASPANLYRVLSLAERHGLVIAEDDVYGHLQPGAATTMAQLAGLSRVIYYSSFCKVLSPALRVGYLVAEPATLQPLLRQKIFASLTGATLNEAVMAELLAGGRVRKHMERLQQRLAAARQATLRVLQDIGLGFDMPGQGGLFLWGRLPDGVALEPLVKDAWAQGILLAGGPTFSCLAEHAQSVRFNVVHAQNVRLGRYLRERFEALAATRRALEKLARG